MSLVFDGTRAVESTVTTCLKKCDIFGYNLSMCPVQMNIVPRCTTIMQRREGNTLEGAGLWHTGANGGKCFAISAAMNLIAFPNGKTSAGLQSGDCDWIHARQNGQLNQPTR